MYLVGLVLRVKPWVLALGAEQRVLRRKENVLVASDTTV